MGGINDRADRGLARDAGDAGCGEIGGRPVGWPRSGPRILAGGRPANGGYGNAGDVAADAGALLLLHAVPDRRHHDPADDTRFPEPALGGAVRGELRTRNVRDGAADLRGRHDRHPAAVDGGNGAARNDGARHRPLRRERQPREDRRADRRLRPHRRRQPGLTIRHTFGSKTMSDAETYDYRRTWPIDPDGPEDGYEAKAPFIDNGMTPISPDRYYTTEYMERERAELWAKVWNWAAREEDIPDVGDFVTFEIGRESFIITRDADDRIRAYFNVCPHRGNRLVSDEEGSRPHGFTCPFHNWRFGVDGKIAQVTDRETFRPEALCRNLDLTEVRCETWEGFVFINMDKDAGPLIEQLGPLPDHAKPYRIRDMRIMRRVQAVWESNWKVGVDGFNEAYHVHAIHPQILPIYDDYHQQIDLYPNGMSRMLTKFALESPRMDNDGLNPGLRAMIAEVGIDPDTFANGKETVRRAVQAAKRVRADRLGIDYSPFTDNQLTDDWNYNIFPNMQLGIHPEGVILLYFRPHATDPRKFVLDAIIMMHPQDNPDILPPAYMGLPEGWDISGREKAEIQHIDWREGGLGEVFDQDASLFAEVQRAIESVGFRGSVLSEQEQRIGHFHAELDRYIPSK
ncbi:(2Fe-2S)-binding protein [Nostoc sp. 3335mG]|nr:(2Fe-2S)-binding protein [Nostoc sp. 3335mG]